MKFPLPNRRGNFFRNPFEKALGKNGLLSAVFRI
jgi:hypothetical protein